MASTFRMLHTLNFMAALLFCFFWNSQEPSRLQASRDKAHVYMGFSLNCTSTSDRNSLPRSHYLAHSSSMAGEPVVYHTTSNK